MSVLHTESFKEFGSFDVSLTGFQTLKMQLEVRSLNVTWRRDLWGSSGHRVFGNVSNCWLNSYGKFGGATRCLFFAIYEKPEVGGADTRPAPAVRGLSMSSQPQELPELLGLPTQRPLLPV